MNVWGIGAGTTYGKVSKVEMDFIVWRVKSQYMYKTFDVIFVLVKQVRRGAKGRESAQQNNNVLKRRGVNQCAECSVPCSLSGFCQTFSDSHLREINCSSASHFTARCNGSHIICSSALSLLYFLVRAVNQLSLQRTTYCPWPNLHRRIE